MPKNFIGGEKEISQEIWALSLVRKESKDHAYLILEGIDGNNQRVTEDIHLVVKPNTNDQFAAICHRNLSLDELYRIMEYCSSETWSINLSQLSKLRENLESEKARAECNLIRYGVMGDSMLSGGGGILPEGVDPNVLLRKSHNCGSWAAAMISAIGLTFTKSLIGSIFAFHPRFEVQGSKNADKKPDSECRIF